MFWRMALNRLTHALMVVTMLLHSILGCCWHHGHAAACASEVRRVASPQAAARATSCCHRHHVHQTAQESDSPGSGASDSRSGAPVPHDHECADEACVYVGSKAPELSHPVPLLAFLGNEDGLLPEPAVRISSESTAEAPLLSRTSLASCALLQVWRL